LLLTACQVIEDILTLPQTLQRWDAIARLRLKAVKELRRWFLHSNRMLWYVAFMNEQNATRLGYQSLLEVLYLPDMKVESENQVFLFIWTFVTRSEHPVAIAIREGKGKLELKTLLGCVRFPCMTLEFLAYVVSDSTIMEQVPEFLSSVAHAIVYHGASQTDRESMRNVALHYNKRSPSMFVSRENARMQMWRHELCVTRDSVGGLIPVSSQTMCMSADGFPYTTMLKAATDSKDDVCILLVLLRKYPKSPYIRADCHKTVTTQLYLYPHGNIEMQADAQRIVTGTFNRITPEIQLFRGSFETFAAAYITNGIVKLHLHFLPAT
jgi:hypothetical protein